MFSSFYAHQNAMKTKTTTESNANAIKARNAAAQKAWHALTPIQRDAVKDARAVSLGFACHGERQAVGENYHRKS